MHMAECDAQYNILRSIGVARSIKLEKSMCSTNIVFLYCPCNMPP